MPKKHRNRTENIEKNDIFKILDMIDLVQTTKKENQTIYVQKRYYKLAKQILKAEKKDSVIKIKTY